MALGLEVDLFVLLFLYLLLLFLFSLIFLIFLHLVFLLFLHPFLLADSGAGEAYWLVDVVHEIKLANNTRVLALGGFGFLGGSLACLLCLKLTGFLDLLLLGAPILEPVLQDAGQLGIRMADERGRGGDKR